MCCDPGAVLGNRGGPGGWEGRGHLPPTPWAAVVCDIANCPASSLLPVGLLFGLSACLAACGGRRGPLPGSVLPRDRPLEGAG